MGKQWDVDSANAVECAQLKVVDTGTDAAMGRATLMAGTLTVNTSRVAATSNIFLTCQTPGGTPGFLRVSARVNGTSFTTLSSSNTDTSVVAWLIVDPAGSDDTP